MFFSINLLEILYFHLMSFISNCHHLPHWSQQADMLIHVPLNSMHIHRGRLETVLGMKMNEVSVGLNKPVGTL